VIPRKDKQAKKRHSRTPETGAERGVQVDCLLAERIRRTAAVEQDPKMDYPVGLQLTTPAALPLEGFLPRWSPMLTVACAEVSSLGRNWTRNEVKLFHRT
jgi:hypothetical protein